MKKVKNRTVTKKEICDQIAEKLSMRQIDVKMIVQSLLDAMIDALSKGHKIELRNFGVFKRVQKKPRVGRNPKTRESVSVPEKMTVKFKPGKKMREKVAKLDENMER